MFDPPIFINVRDRVTHLRSLVAWLETAGHERIVLLDNASTYEPLIEYLRSTPHDVVCLGANLGSRAIWHAGLVPSEWFVYTDPDLVPLEDCPHDAVAYLRDLLEPHPEYPKAGLGLYLEDVPASLDSLGWERSLVSAERELYDPSSPVSALCRRHYALAYGSLVDTTFALYRPNAPHEYRAIRTGWPYQCRHMPWYVTEPDEEDRYYLQHATAGPLGSSWAQARA